MRSTPKPVGGSVNAASRRAWTSPRSGDGWPSRSSTARISRSRARRQVGQGHRHRAPAGLALVAEAEDVEGQAPAVGGGKGVEAGHGRAGHPEGQGVVDAVGREVAQARGVLEARGRGLEGAGPRGVAVARRAVALRAALERRAPGPARGEGAPWAWSGCGSARPLRRGPARQASRTASGDALSFTRRSISARRVSRESDSGASFRRPRPMARMSAPKRTCSSYSRGSRTTPSGPTAPP